MSTPPDVEAMQELVEAVRKQRLEGWVIDLLDEPPVHVPGCDDPHGKFAWYEKYHPDKPEEPRGYFHLPHEVDL